jgi:hypothetical protein
MLGHPFQERFEIRQVLDVPELTGIIPTSAKATGFVFLFVGDVQVDSHAVGSFLALVAMKFES